MKENKYKEGDKSKGICKNCKKLVTTTFVLEKWPELTNKILVSKCNNCLFNVGIVHDDKINKID